MTVEFPLSALGTIVLFFFVFYLFHGLILSLLFYISVCGLLSLLLV